MRTGTGAIVAIILLVLLSGAFGFLYYNATLNDQELQSQASEAREELQDARARAEALNEDKDELRQSIEATERRLSQANTMAESLRTQLQSAEREKNQLESTIQNKNSEINTLKGEIAKLRKELSSPNALVQQLQKDVAAAKARAEELNKQVLAQQQARRVEREAGQGQVRRLRQQIDKLRSVINEYQSVNRARAEATGEIHDGKILEVDIDRRFAVIDLGSIHRVQPGMQFRAIRRRGTEWVDMGTLEIVKVAPATSTCTILTNVERQPICPVTGWVGEPGMRYSPFASITQGRVREAVPLQPGEMREVSSMDPLDPIIAGDYVTNPVYSRDQELTFAVAGKSQWSMEELKALLERYGGTLAEAVGPETDYLILASIPMQADTQDERDAEARDAAIAARDAAQQYGIPIVREVELLEFLNN